MGDQQIEDSGHYFFTECGPDFFYWNKTASDFILPGIKKRKTDGFPGIAIFPKAQQRFDFCFVVLQLEVPAAAVVPPKADAAVWDAEAAGSGVIQNRLPLGVFAVCTQVRRSQKSLWHISFTFWLKHNNKWQVRVPWHI